MHKINNKKGIRQLHTVYPEHAGMLIKLVEGPHGFGSGSDVVRKAIVELYNKFYPPYKGPTFKQAKQLEEKEALDSIPDDVFATETLKGKIIQDSLERKFVLIYWFIPNSFAHFPLEGIKEWAAANTDALQRHLDISKEEPITSVEFSQYTKNVYEQEHGIILE